MNETPQPAHTQEPATIDAAYRFVESIIPKADVQFPSPPWHGWALREAFIAGANHACANIPDPASARALLKEAEETIRLLIKSAHPQRQHHPTMWVAWEQAEKTLAALAALAALPAPENKL